MDPELTHENAKKKIQQEEAVKEQNQGLSSAGKAGDRRDNSIEIGYVVRKHCSAMGRQQLSQHADGTRSTLLEKLHRVLDVVVNDTVVLNALRETPPATSVEKGDILALNASPSGRTCQS